jgi:hypothetical protein
MESPRIHCLQTCPRNRNPRIPRPPGSLRQSPQPRCPGRETPASPRNPCASVSPRMVLDGAHPVDAAHPGFPVPLAGLLAGQVVRVHAVDWTGRGPRFSAFTQPLAARPAVSFPAANAPYLVGVITATAPLVPPAPPAPITTLPSTHQGDSYPRSVTPPGRSPQPSRQSRRARPRRPVESLCVKIPAIGGTVTPNHRRRDNCGI